MATSISETVEQTLATVDLTDDGNVQLTVRSFFPSRVVLTVQQARALADALTTYASEAAAYLTEQAS
ncbi:hypothetical protein [Microbacterium sp. KR10-403]|uniref:hypothetical protein n=1 Tax=Microbacterium sp. KR10-403 TaxID=3158581 RepID=UPI0032E3EAE1